MVEQRGANANANIDYHSECKDMRIEPRLIQQPGYLIELTATEHALLLRVLRGARVSKDDRDALLAAFAAAPVADAGAIAAPIDVRQHIPTQQAPADLRGATEAARREAEAIAARYPDAVGPNLATVTVERGG